MVRDPQPEDDSSIIIPEDCRIYSPFGTVVQIGEKVKKVVVGDRVMFHKNYTYLPFEQRRAAITQDSKVIGIIKTKNKRESMIPLNAYLLIKPEEGRRVIEGIELPNAPESAQGGFVMNVGADCLEVEPGARVFYNHPLAIYCSLGDDKLHIIPEEHILCQIPKN
jgi:hypothetical protein